MAIDDVAKTLPVFPENIDFVSVANSTVRNYSCLTENWWRNLFSNRFFTTCVSSRGRLYFWYWRPESIPRGCGQSIVVPSLHHNMFSITIWLFGPSESIELLCQGSREFVIIKVTRHRSGNLPLNMPWLKADFHLFPQGYRAKRIQFLLILKLSPRTGGNFFEFEKEIEKKTKNGFARKISPSGNPP